MPNAAFDSRTAALLGSLRDSGQYKHLHHVLGPLGATANLEGVGEVIVMCSNNYLGLASHPEVIAAGHEGLKEYGAGTASVRFICGTLGCHRTIEQAIARFAGTEAALTYVSAWNANEALIPTVAGPNDIFISDELNHASIIDGMRLLRGGAEKTVYKHADMADLEVRLKEHARKETRWVVTDGVFSMEGAVAKLPQILELCRRYDAMLIVDDSHGHGVLGQRGRGTAEHFGLHGEIDVITGTLGKALGGAAGGFVAAKQNVIDLLVQRSRPQLFSNALPATVAFSANKAIEIVEREPQRVTKLHENVRKVRDGLRSRGFDAQDAPSAIIPIMIGDAADAIRKSQRLLELGVWVVAFGYPVVPQGKARLRVQVSAALEDAHLQRALDAFAKL
jgi:glycine C-acetyltransferase